MVEMEMFNDLALFLHFLFCAIFLTSYFVKLKNLLLHIRTIFFVSSHCDERLMEFAICSLGVSNLHLISVSESRFLNYD